LSHCIICAALPTTVNAPAVPVSSVIRRSGGVGWLNGREEITGRDISHGVRGRIASMPGAGRAVGSVDAVSRRRWSSVPASGLTC